MRRQVLVAGLVVLLATTLGASSGATNDFAHLDPGGPVNLAERVPVQFVFVGFDGTVNTNAFLAQLPSVYKPVVRSRLWYGVVEELGVTYTYDYQVFVAPRAYEDRLFAALTARAEPADLTLFQQRYNAQRRNAQTVVANHFIDAPSVEKWLIDNPPAGVNTRRNTVFFINWWNRPDFIFHVYTKFGEPDPDTGYDFGVQRASRKIVAWGGTTPDDEETGLGSHRGVHRVWFYDLSAGPESWGGNWNVDSHDLDGDGAADYRIPVYWEYGSYRPLSELSRDLGLVARYGAVNLLFTPSPLYPPYITPDRQPRAINLDMNTYEGWPGVDASERYQTQPLALQEIGEVHRVPYNLDDQDVPLTGMAQECLVKWLNGAKCDSERPQYHAFADLWLYNALNIAATWDGGAEYEAMFFNYATTANVGFLGFADDNWFDGTQSFTFNFVYPAVASFYGLTTTQIHEYGHHFGMSHPHDGYDSLTGVDYGPTGPYYFAWLADEVNSMMSYIDLNWDYSQFDRDNANRFQTAAYIRSANRIAGDIVASPDAAQVHNDLKKADQAVGQANAAFAAHDYVAAFDAARQAYELVRGAAARIGVPVEASSLGWFVLPPRREFQGPVKREYSYADRIGPGTKRWEP